MSDDIETTQDYFRTFDQRIEFMRLNRKVDDLVTAVAMMANMMLKIQKEIAAIVTELDRRYR